MVNAVNDTIGTELLCALVLVVIGKSNYLQYRLQRCGCRS